MTTTSVNPGGWLINAAAGSGERNRDGSAKSSDTNFSGLLSLLSAKADSDGGVRSGQAQPSVAGTAISTMLVGGVQPPPADAPARDPLEGLHSTDGQVVQADESEAPVAAGDAVLGDHLVLASRSEAEPNLTSIDDAYDHDANTTLIIETDTRAGEIQALLSSVMRRTLPEAAATAQVSAKTTSASASAAATLLPGARAKTGGDTTGIATQPGSEEPDTATQPSGDMGWIEPGLSGLDLQDEPTASSRGKDQGLASALAGDVKISVLQTQTHHAPVLLGGPIAQIADSIRAELTGDSEISLQWSAADSGAARLGSDAPVKVLLIQLQPADLGTVTVRMSLKEDTLELHIEASQRETAQRLQQDQETLSKVLRSAGYLIDSAAIRVTEPDRSMVLPGNAGSQGSSTLPQSSYQGSAGGAQSDGSASQGRAQHGHTGRGHPDQTATADANGQQRPSPGGLYV